MKKQSNGKYRTKIVIGHDDTGKPINKWISAPTKRELEEKRREVTDLYINHNRSSENVLFGVYAKQWFKVIKEPHIAIGTARMYACVLNKHLLPTFKDRPLRSISAMDLQEYINSLSEYSHGRVNTIRIVLRGIYESALTDTLVTVNPANHLRIDAKPAKERQSLTAAERAAIENVCRTHPDGLLMALLYYTGMRDGEVCGLTWSDIHLAERTITIRRALKHDRGTPYFGPPKTKSSARSIPIPAPLADILRRTPAGFPDQLVIHGEKSLKPLGLLQLRVRWSRLMQAANLGEPKDLPHNIHWAAAFTPHTLRHNYTTMLYENGIDPYTASRLLGHSSVKTTLDIYTHFSQKALNVARTQLDGVFSKSSDEVAK